MTAPSTVDFARIRAKHPIAEVVAAAGVDLHPRGHGWVGCCPFHDDSSPSMTVDAIPDRFHCFGCGATGDVVDFVGRMHGLGVRDAVAFLDEGRVPTGVPAARPRLRLVRDHDHPTVAPDRAFEINALAWNHLASPTAASFASGFLWHARGIDLTTLRAEAGVELVGYASHSWTSLTDRLRAEGVTDDELLALDLSQRARTGSLIDTLRGRLIFPITEPDGRTHGFIGRDTTGNPAAPKYRNPTRTPVHDKSEVLYRPTHHRLSADGHVVVVEGVLDALALTAAAAQDGLSHRIAAVTASGVTVSRVQAEQVLALSDNPPRIALDGDQAGRDGTDRWLTALSVDRHLPALVTTLPEGTDPADWLTATDHPSRLIPFVAAPEVPGPTANAWRHDQPWDGAGTRLADSATTSLPGRDIVRLTLERASDPVRDTVNTVVRLSSRLGPGLRHALVEEATSEMTRRGWNPNGTFATALERGLQTQPSGIPPPERTLTRPAGPDLL